MRVLLLCSLALAATTAHADRLPVRVFTTTDGLASNRVDSATQDTHGFLWFATYEGVSRFDSRRFESFGLEDGLPAAITHAVLATPDGAVWVGTDAGLALLDSGPAVRPHFHAVTSETTYALAADPDGGVWVGTARGLQHIDQAGRLSEVAFTPGVLSIAPDARDHSLWLGTRHGLAHRSQAGDVTRWRLAPANEADDRVFGVLVARDGAVWAGSVSAYVVRLPTPLAPSTTPLVETPGVNLLRPTAGARRGFLEDATGTVWIGTGLDTYRWTAGRFERRSLGPHTSAGPLLEDRAGNLWFGTDTDGVIRLAHGGFVSFDESDGFLGFGAYGFAIEPTGILDIAVRHTTYTLARLVGDRFESLPARSPSGSLIGTWSYGAVMVVGRDGQWWLPFDGGLMRYPAGTVFDGNQRGEVVRGLPGSVLHLYEDQRGDVWISTADEIGLVRWDHATDQIVTPRGSWPKEYANSFADDAHGDLWVAYQTHLIRVHDDAPIEVPAALNNMVALMFDRAGRLWIASEGEGVSRIDDPAHPVARRYRRAELGSDHALSLVEDLQGRIYVGTSRGIARIDPATGEIVHFDTADGLPGAYVHAATRTPDGALWFGMKHGLARLVPERGRIAEPARIFITRLAIGGVPQPLAAGGETAVRSFELAHDETGIDVEVASPQFALDSGVRFQYRLDGTWSTPVDEPALHFGRLAPGDYDLEVRAIDARGVTSPSATVAFRVLPPIWRRWWFMALAALAIGGLAYAWYRRRLAHMLALERVRRRIASDLHDELGSSLSRISILSEVARRSEGAPEKLGGQLEVIGTSARELVDVASDIVWSTDPRRDDLHSLIVRLRSFAADIFDARGIGWSVKAPTEPDKIKLDPERRRHLYLVLKEAIANAAKHSGATRVDVSIGFERSGLVARVRDNGKGFDEASLSGTGNGLTNMRARAEEAGGTLEIRADQGTEIVLRL